MIRRLDPAGYRRTPWKNGGGVSIGIAAEGETWSFNRTAIATPGPFSDYSGHDRVQVLVAGRGLVLATPNGEIDVRTPFEPVRFAGETPIASRLEAGPVEVVNLIGARALVRIDLRIVDTSRPAVLHPGTHIAYCVPAESARVDDHELAGDHALRIDPARRTILAASRGRVVLASILRV